MSYVSLVSFFEKASRDEEGNRTKYQLCVSQMVARDAPSFMWGAIPFLFTNRLVGGFI